MSEMSLEVQRNCKATPNAVPANREAGRYADLHNPNMDTELFARLRARRVMMEKWETGDDAIQTRTKTPKSSVKRPHQPDIVCKSPLLSADLINEIERLKEICELRTKELHTVRTKLNERNLGFEAMIVLVKYLTEELNAFSCPVLVVQLQDVKGQLANASKQLDDLIQMRNFLIQERERLQEKQKNELFRLHVSHQVEQQSLESRVKEEAQRKQEEVLQQLSCELNGVQLKHNEELNVLKVHHEQDVQTREESHADALARLDAQLNEKIAELNSSHEAQVEDLTKQFEDAKLCLLEKVTQLKTECDDLRSREKSYSTTYQQESEIKIQNALLPYRYLEQEVESLRVVMDLRNQELAQLRQNKREMEKQLEEIPVARETINKLQQKIENLEAIINIKVDYEKELAEKHHVLLRKYDRESKAKKRLSMDNEELVWRLSQSEVGSTPDVFRMSLSQLPTIPSGGHRDVHEPRQRPKSMVLLSPPTTPSGVGGTDKPPLYRASQSTGGVKLRRPRMFASVDHNLASDMKLSEIKQSDV